LDLVKGFYQLKLALASRRFFGFRWRGVTYTFKVLPFGWIDSPALFNQRVQHLLCDSSPGGIKAYVDDLPLGSSSFGALVQSLTALFQRCRQHCFFLKGSKCILNAAALDLLGVNVSRGTIAPAQDKLDVISSFPLPSRAKQLKGYVGLLEWHHSMMPVEAPFFADWEVLHSKMKNAPKVLTWSDEERGAFDRSKLWLQDTVVHTVVPGDDLHLYTDASATAIGGALVSQRGVVAYFHQCLTPCQRNWAVTCREMFGVVKALMKFEKILPDYPYMKLSVHTDNLACSLLASSSLHKLHKILDNVATRGRWLRWLGFLSCFPRVSFSHLPGEVNIAADLWSRLPELCIECPNHGLDCE
jgi:hypothetical protein